VGGTDALLLNFAIRSGASLFATFDNGFRRLTHPLIQALIIPDVYSI
jgi:predicted nucleic acid-binding protein